MNLLSLFNKKNTIKKNIYLILAFSALSLIAVVVFAIRLNKNKKPQVVLIGATGKQGQAYFNVLKDSVDFVAFVVSSKKSLKEDRRCFLEFAEQNNIQVFESIEGLKEGMSNKTVDFEVAILAVPHDLHREYTALLLQANKIVLKEKPLAINYSEIEYYENLLNTKDLPIFTIVQRHFNASLQNAKKDLYLIGEPLSFSYEYCFNLPSVTSGWRAEKSKSGGGVVIDMGYHIIDIVNDFFGMPIVNKTSAFFNFYYEDMFQKILEDEAFIHFEYLNGLQGQIKLSRHDFAKEEFLIKGSLGLMKIDIGHYEIYDLNNNLIKLSKSTQTKAQNNFTMLDSYIRHRHDKNYLNEELLRHKNNVYIIDQIYKVAKINNNIIQRSL